MRNITKILTVCMVMIGMFSAFAPVVSAGNGIDICAGDGSGSVYCNNKSDGEGKVNGIIGSIVQVLLTAVGVISVIMIVIGGIMFATSSGDAQKTAKARNTILYAVIGLVVSIFAAAIVNFAFSNFK
ncbi:membrane protein [Candidatus Nanosynbacter lyticus]|jgi:hypothetical protein cdiviTM7_00627|uniref:Membrane protein n=2 Tax=Candidatus Nanosynbacter lyticus TaxID=2093824 RepID=A0A6S4GQ64_9BACT|nr:membrane protein [Candidatus Nanosynbacter lyticus]